MSSQGITVRKYASARGGGWIERYAFAERVNHWIGSAAYLYLLVTGLAFWSPYLYWMAALVGGGPTARFWHPWIGVLFTASTFIKSPFAQFYCCIRSFRANIEDGPRSRQNGGGHRKPKSSVSGMLNVLHNIGSSIRTAIITTMIARRAQYHQRVLVDHITPDTPACRESLKA